MGLKPTYDDVRTTGQPQFLHNWRLTIINVPKGLNERWGALDAALSWKCLTSDIPTSQSVNTSVVIRGHEVGYTSGIRKYSRNMALAFVEDTDGTIKEFIKDWTNLASEYRTGKGRKKEDVEMDFELVMLDAEDADDYNFYIQGAIPGNPALGSLTNGANASIQEPVINIEYDISDMGQGAMSEVTS